MGSLGWEGDDLGRNLAFLNRCLVFQIVLDILLHWPRPLSLCITLLPSTG
jgi:hypothetical protein